MARRVGLSEHRAGEVRAALAEAASNLQKHAVDGALLLRIVRTAEHAGVEFLAVDRGPGIADTAASMRDGLSTTGTFGIGRRMIARLADTFDLHTAPGHGTVLMAQFWPRTVPGRPAAPDGVDAQPAGGGVTRPIGTERECGDGWQPAGTTPDPPPGRQHPRRTKDGRCW
ncbi:ATP-binding protein [Streptomyces sp. NPDC091272]|uniref:ATP-binding protein n=1 Tax=Streptomyces sp. NPDC091272 TaxID=3365981 RepID=UPI0038195EDD